MNPKAKYEPTLDMNYATIVVDETITAAADKVEAKIEEFLADNANIKMFYIGKTFVDGKDGKVEATNTKEWITDGGLGARYYNHRVEPYGNLGILIVALVKHSSIPKQCITDGYIVDHEGYALRLEESLIKRFREKKDKRLANEFTKSGGQANQPHNASLVYLAYGDGKKK